MSSGEMEGVCVVVRCACTDVRRWMEDVVV